jgi:hypothetical protein
VDGRVKPGHGDLILADAVRGLFQTVINEHGADKDAQILVKLFERTGNARHRTQG